VNFANFAATYPSRRAEAQMSWFSLPKGTLG
jgi:hypothetical protein